MPYDLIITSSCRTLIVTYQQANGLISLVDYGLAHVDDGFGPPLGIPAPEIGDHSTAVGVLAFPYQTNDVSGVSNKIDELSTMITAGRLSLENKQVLLVRFYRTECLFLRQTQVIVLTLWYAIAFRMPMHTSVQIMAMTLLTRFF
jgi:hypothetical protein